MASNMESNQSGPGPFDQPDSHRTLAIEVEDRKFYVPRDLMAAYSPAFKAMLYGEFAEAKKDVIQLREKKAEDIEELLRCLIPAPMQKPIDDSNFELILRLSDEYQIEELHNRAELFLTIKVFKICDKSDPELLELLRLGSKYRMKDLLLECIKRCAMEFELAKLEGMFKELPCEVVAGLMLYGHKISCPFNVQCTFELYNRDKTVYCKTHNQTRTEFCKFQEPEKETRVRELLNRMP